MKTKQKSTPKKRTTITFDPPDDVRLLLQKAQEATGATATDLIAEAIRTDLPAVVRKILDNRKAAEAEFWRLAEAQAGNTQREEKKKTG